MEEGLSEYNRKHADIYAKHVKHVDSEMKKVFFTTDKGAVLTVVDFNRITRDLINKLSHFEAIIP